MALTSGGDDTFGFVVRNLKDQNFPAFARLEIALRDSVMFLTSNGVIARGAVVENVFATPGQVIASAGFNPVIGWAVDAATGAGQLIRVFLNTPTGVGSAVPAERSLLATVTLAQINAGLVLIPGIAGKKIRVLAVTQRVLGNFATGTSVVLKSDATNVAVVTTAEAGLTDGSFLFSGDSHNTIGAGFFADLPAGEGLKVANNGANQTGGTSIAYGLVFTQS